MKTDVKYTNDKHILELVEKNGVPYFVYPMLLASNAVKHGFSTRMGGVSEGVCSSMNLSFSRNDKHEAVVTNFERMAQALDIQAEDFVFSQQTHTTNVRVVTEEDRGKGLTKALDYEEIDGLVTNVPGICLATFYADRVPLFFVDPVHHAIGLSHSGWRGTVGKIGSITLDKMKQEFGTSPNDVIAAIGPSICQNCYEVDEDVITEFKENFKVSQWPELFYEKPNGKYQLDLWKANEIVLCEAGIPKEQIAVTNLCTCCNDQLLFSHRASNGKRGNLGAFLALNKGG